MSDETPTAITPIAVVDDAARLARASTAVADRVRQALARHPDAVRIGGAMPDPAGNVPRFLEGYRGEDDIDHERLSIVAGAAAHAAAETHLDCVAAAGSGADDRPSSSRDAVVLSERAVEAVDPAATDVEALADGFDTMWRRSIMRLHTLIPDYDDAEGWMTRLFRWREQDRQLRREYAEALSADGSLAHERSEDGSPFYDPDGEVTSFARSLQVGSVDGSEIDRVVESAAPSSDYGRGVRAGYLAIRASGGFLEGDVDRETLSDRLSGENGE